MIPKEAIEKAISAEWGEFHTRSRRAFIEYSSEVGWHKVALDPTFWKSLVGNGWLIKAETFCSLILTGGDVQAFWDDLLGK